MDYKKLSIFAAVFVVMAFLYFVVFKEKGKTPSYTRAVVSGNTTKTVNVGLSELLNISLAGSTQTLLIRGLDTNAPVLFYIPAGPGGSELAWTRHYLTRLEERMIVVNWDAPGCGTAYDSLKTISNYTHEFLKTNAAAVVTYLTNRFPGQPLILAGRGYGAMLAAETARDMPGAVRHLLLIAPLVAPLENDLAIYGFALAEATQASDTNAVKDLTAAGMPPYTNTNWIVSYGRMTEVAAVYSGKKHSPSDFSTNWLKVVHKAGEYTAEARKSIWRSYFQIFQAVYPAVLSHDLRKTVPAMRCPVTFIHGSYDVLSSTNLSGDYYRKVQAPSRRFVWMTNSGNAPLFEEPAEFARVLGELKL